MGKQKRRLWMVAKTSQSLLILLFFCVGGEKSKKKKKKRRRGHNLLPRVSHTKKGGRTRENHLLQKERRPHFSHILSSSLSDNSARNRKEGSVATARAVNFAKKLLKTARFGKKCALNISRKFTKSTSHNSNLLYYVLHKSQSFASRGNTGGSFQSFSLGNLINSPEAQSFLSLSLFLSFFLPLPPFFLLPLLCGCHHSGWEDPSNGVLGACSVPSEQI